MTDQNRSPVMLNQETLHGPLGEAFRLLYANLGFNSTEPPPKSIAVISALSKDGRTMTAVNLGIVIAEAGHRAVVVEADFRRPAIGNVMAWGPWRSDDQRSVHGLRSIIAGAATVQEALRPAPFDRLSVLPAGPIPPNFSEVIGSQRMRDVLAELAELFDYVVLDTPPCLLYADALLISSMVDGVVYVVRAGPQDRAAQQRAQQQLQHARARVLGAVFNDVAAVEIARYGGQHANRQMPSAQVVPAGGKLHPRGSSVERTERSRWDRLIALYRPKAG